MRDYQDMVFATASRLSGNDAVAQDIAQEVFLRAYEHFGLLRDRIGAGGWLKTVTLRLTLNHLGRYRRRWRLFSELVPAALAPAALGPGTSPVPGGEEHTGIERAAASLDSVFAITEAGQRAQLVRGALAALPDAQRLPLVLFHYEELSYQQIAAALAVSVAKVKTDILRGRLALARRLGGTDLSSPASGEQT